MPWAWRVVRRSACPSRSDAIAISSGAKSTSSVTAMSRNKWGKIGLPNASRVCTTIWRWDSAAAHKLAAPAEPQPTPRARALSFAHHWSTREPGAFRLRVPRFSP